jgi:arabinogalactan oligomer/maltooligosaccharide transport system substrate-binding protein
MEPDGEEKGPGTMSHEKELRSLMDQVTAGTLSRRDAIRRAALLGAGAAAMGSVARAAAQDASPQASPAAVTPSYEPQGPQAENLVVWTRSSPDASPAEWDALIAVAARYTELVGTPVEFVTVPDADFRTRLNLASPEGEGPDVFGPIAHDWIGELALPGILMPFSREQLHGIEDIPDNVLSAVQYEGQIYGYPVFSESLVLFHNKDIIPEAPTTWDELVQMATEATTSDQYGFAFELLAPYYQGAFFHAFGGYIFKNNDGTLDFADIGLNNEGSVEAAKFLRDMFNQQMPPMPEDILDQTNAGAFLDGLEEQGLLGMRIAGPWRFPTLTDAGVNFGVAPLPTAPNGEPLQPFGGFQFWGANAYSENADAAMDLVNFLGSTEGMSYLLEGFNRPPVLNSLRDAAVEANPNFAAIMEQVEVAVPMPNIPQMSQVWLPWTDAMVGIVQQNVSDEDVQALLDAAVDQIETNIAQNS